MNTVPLYTKANNVFSIGSTVFVEIHSMQWNWVFSDWECW